jgi:hypothetical protein
MVLPLLRQQDAQNLHFSKYKMAAARRQQRQFCLLTC